MKISKIIFALAIGSMIIVTSCREANTKTETTEEHGHEHDADGNHKEDKVVVGQEEFNVNETSENKEENSVKNNINSLLITSRDQTCPFVPLINSNSPSLRD